MFRTAIAFLLLTAGSGAIAQATAPTAAVPDASVITAPLPPDEAAMKAHVMFLSSDALKGREAGTEEYEIAAQYVASQFYAQGLRPAGDNGTYLQKVPLVSYRPADKGTFTLTRPGAAPRRLVFGEDYVPGADPEREVTQVSAPVVFVGYGIVAPQFGRDDYAGADVKGKIVAYLSGAPAKFPGEERAHFGNSANKAVVAKRHGAAGVIVLESPVSAKVRPFARSVDNWDHASMTWANPDGSGHNDAPGLPRLGTLSMKGAEKLFAGAPIAWSTLVKQAETDGATFRPVQLPGTLSVTLRTARENVGSSNVAGILPGSDPALKDELVVLSAHLDHVGVGKAVNGDTIYNGAEDNAVGIASLIEEARRFKESGKPPRRSILFLAVTAEEKGLVGSDYFATNPTVPKDKIVANVNLDMPILTYKFEDMIAFGADRSTLGPIVRDAVARLGVGFSPDPMPEQGIFVRSDHYRFVQQGVPSVFLWPGQKGPGKAAVDEFFAKHYHQPSDQLGIVPIDWTQGVRFIEANYHIARAIADADQRPRWKKGDFFGTLYHGYGAVAD